MREPSLDEARAALRGAGLRATPARLAVLRALVGRNAPLSHAEVCEAVEGGGFDRATVYRNLVDLADAGLVRRADLGDHVWRFEPVATAPGEAHDPLHPHFVCDTCGEVTCLPGDSVTVAPTVALPRAVRGAGRAGVAIHIRGTCDDCG